MHEVDFFESSLSYCSEKCYYSRRQVLQLLRRNCPTVHSRVRYAVAREFGRYLGENYGDVRAVYVYGSTMQDKAGKTSDIDLIILVTQKTANLVQLIRQLNEKLMDQYRYLLDDSTLPLHCMLDAHIVDDSDVVSRQGYGTVISSIFNPPTKIWGRESGDKVC